MMKNIFPQSLISIISFVKMALSKAWVHIYISQIYLSEDYAFIVLVMCKQKWLFVPHHQLLLWRAHFLRKGQLSSATANCKWGNSPWFSKRRDIKALLNMDSSAASTTFSRQMHSLESRASSLRHCRDLPKPRRPAAPSFQPSPGGLALPSRQFPLQQVLPGHWPPAPPRLLRQSQPTHPSCWHPQTRAAKPDLEVCKGFPQTGNGMLSPHA